MKRRPPDPRSTTLDFGDGEIRGSTIEDVHSEADDALIARGGVHGSKIRRIMHRRERPSRAVVVWTALGALAAIVVPVVIALVA
jgi:hypothetical protein